MAETPQQRAERLNKGRGFSGHSYSVLNGEVVRRNNGLHLLGQTDWQNLQGETAGRYKQPPQTKPTTQNANPFGQNFAPFEMPDNAPIRAIPVIGQKTEAQRNAAPQNSNPFAPNFQPFYIPDNAPIRQVIGPRPSNSGGYYGPGGNPDASGQGQAQQDPGIGPYQGHTPGLPRPSQPTDERTTENENGVTQTMRAMSSTSTPIDMNRSFNDLLGTVGGGQFSSNQLPTTGANPFEGKPPETQTFNTGAESYTGNSLANFGGDGSAAFAPSRETTGNDTFNPSAARIEGGSSRPKAGSLEAALADTDGINSYMSKFSSGDRQRAANRAFLDADDSMSGLRAKEAANGVVYAGGQHYMSGESGDDQAIAIDRSQARDISSGKSTAQGLLDAHIAKNKQNAGDSAPVEQQAPAVLEQGARDGAFQQDKPMFNGTTRAIGGAVEFDNNNDQTLPTFGAPKGYKPQSAYKDPVFPNPFAK